MIDARILAIPLTVEPFAYQQTLVDWQKSVRKQNDGGRIKMCWYLNVNEKWYWEDVLLTLLKRVKSDEEDTQRQHCEWNRLKDEHDVFIGVCLWWFIVSYSACIAKPFHLCSDEMLYGYTIKSKKRYRKWMHKMRWRQKRAWGGKRKRERQRDREKTGWISECAHKSVHILICKKGNWNITRIINSKQTINLLEGGYITSYANNNLSWLSVIGVAVLVSVQVLVAWS